MRQIPLSLDPNQSLGVVLGGQNCKIRLAQRSTGLYLDLFVNDAPVVQSVLCRDRVKIVRGEHLGFVGELVFIDRFGRLDPDYSGLTGRFALVYIEAHEL
ncbi:phage baseplate plug family protein [Bordetella sp. 02P26C-1]|uniref:phage baseplate plug family protein n=1 Tax=Bordetella sp. 02P26C-1 TaxID=2683195 RepID=UPI0013521EED|nr:hypothetical protein [Bordetella sp. 02P26C-1]MVW80172.1 hypothetical protein [Bordetella sp. 02P26C-1]